MHRYILLYLYTHVVSKEELFPDDAATSATQATIHIITEFIMQIIIIIT